MASISDQSQGWAVVDIFLAKLARPIKIVKTLKKSPCDYSLTLEIDRPGAETVLKT